MHGSLLSPAVANIINKEMLEEHALSTASHSPRIGQRYVDDIHVLHIMETKHMDRLLNFINNLRHTIKFTMEQEKGISPFLDTPLTGKASKDQHVCIRKTTHTKRYLQCFSHHQEYVERGLAFCLFHQARTVAVGENILNEDAI